MGRRAVHNPQSFLSGRSTWPDGGLLARRPCDWPLGLWPRDIWLAVHGRTIPLIPYFTPALPPSPPPLPHAPFISLCVTLTGLLPKDNCSALCGLVGLFIPGFMATAGRKTTVIAPHNRTVIQHSLVSQGGFLRRIRAYHR